MMYSRWNLQNMGGEAVDENSFNYEKAMARYANTSDNTFNLQGRYYLPTLNSVKKMKKHIESGNSIPSTALYSAVVSHNMKLVKFLLEQGVEVDGDKDQEYTPLIAACIFNRCKENRIGLNRAVWMLTNLVIIVQLLLNYKANVNATDSAGKTAFEHILTSAFSTKFKHHPLLFNIGTEIIYLLARYKFDVRRTYSENKTVLHLICEIETFDSDSRERKQKMLREYLSRGADVDARSKDGLTPLHVAALESRYNHDEFSCMRILLEHGADVNAATWYSAELNGRLDRELCQKKEDRTILHIRWYFPYIRKMLEYGADINKQDKDGNTVLHHAASHFNVSFLKHFLDNEADPTIKNRFGVSPLHCRSAGSEQVQDEMRDIFMRHLYILKRLRLSHLCRDKDEFDEFCRQHSNRLTQEFILNVEREIERMKFCRFDDYTTHYDLFFRNVQVTLPEGRERTFFRVFPAKYEIFGFMLAYRLRKNMIRNELLEPAKRTLILLTKFPNSVVDKVFKNYTYAQLKHFIKACITNESIRNEAYGMGASTNIWIKDWLDSEMNLHPTNASYAASLSHSYTMINIPLI